MRDELPSFILRKVIQITWTFHQSGLVASKPSRPIGTGQALKGAFGHFQTS